VLPLCLFESAKVSPETMVVEAAGTAAEAVEPPNRKFEKSMTPELKTTETINKTDSNATSGNSSFFLLIFSPFSLSHLLLLIHIEPVFLFFLLHPEYNFNPKKVP
jgi:hypothetical protein